MSVELKNPALQKFIQDEVRAGHFPSAEAAVEAAVAQMQLDHSDTRLTEDDLRAIAESDMQIERGELIDFDQFESEMRKKYCK